jgi:hypothetical protein
VFGDRLNLLNYDLKEDKRSPCRGGNLDLATDKRMQFPPGTDAVCYEAQLVSGSGAVRLFPIATWDPSRAKSVLLRIVFATT